MDVAVDIPAGPATSNAMLPVTMEQAGLLGRHSGVYSQDGSNHS
jgi:hypothetical protein